MYKILAVTGLDSRLAVAISGHAVQGMLAGVCDWYLYQLARRWYGVRIAKWAFFAQVICVFRFPHLTQVTP